VLASIRELDVRARDQIDDGPRDDDLASFRQRGYACTDHDRQPRDVIASQLDGPPPEGKW
jgi:hypothetical protein